MTTTTHRQSTASHDHSTYDLGDLAALVAGRVLVPTDADYAQVATPWNVSVANPHVAVVPVASAEDVAAVVRYAAEHGLEVAVQATGHGAATSSRESILIHTGLLDELTVRPDGFARVGAGVRWDALIAAAAPYGLAALAGSSPNVGVVGFLTGGGLGPVARTYGVSSDYVTAFDLVTGDGVVRRASAEENPALFWALRGGKGTVGIVTAVEMDLVPLRELFGGCLFFDGADTARVLHSWRAWSARLPEQATTSIAIVRLPPLPHVPPPLAGKVAVAVRFAWIGDAESGQRAATPMLGAGRIVLGGYGVMPYAALASIHMDPVDPMPVAEASTLLSELTDETVDALVALTGPDAECPQVIVELRHLGGAITRPRSGASAMTMRDAAYNLMLIGIAAPPVVAATTGHAAQVLEAMAPWSTEQCLPNFAATTDPAQVARKYTPEALARLASLADAYDPHGVIAAARPVREAALL